MNSRPSIPLLPSFPLLPYVFLTATASVFAASFLATAAQAQTPPMLTATLSGSGTATFKSGPVDFRNYTFNIIGFSNVGPDPNGTYTIYSFSNNSLENSANFFGVSPFNLPTGWSFTDTGDFIISTNATGIHAFDPSFGLTIFQTAGTPAIDPTGAPFELFHKVDGVDPFLDLNGQPMTIPVNAVPEESSLISFGLLLLGGTAWQARRKFSAV